MLDRAENRHTAFGLGIHRCLGSNLARLELTVALQEWIRAFPDYQLDPAFENSDAVTHLLVTGFTGASAVSFGATPAARSAMVSGPSTGARVVPWPGSSQATTWTSRPR